MFLCEKMRMQWCNGRLRKPPCLTLHDPKAAATLGMHSWCSHYVIVYCVRAVCVHVSKSWRINLRLIDQVYKKQTSLFQVLLLEIITFALICSEIIRHIVWTTKEDMHLSFLKLKSALWENNLFLFLLDMKESYFWYCVVDVISFFFNVEILLILFLYLLLILYVCVRVCVC